MNDRNAQQGTINELDFLLGSPPPPTNSPPHIFSPNFQHQAQNSLLSTSPPHLFQQQPLPTMPLPYQNQINQQSPTTIRPSVYPPTTTSPPLLSPNFLQQQQTQFLTPKQPHTHTQPQIQQPHTHTQTQQSSPTLDAISLFLKSSQADFSFDSLLTLGNNRGVVDEISHYLREKNSDQGNGTQLFSTADLKWSSFLAKPQVGIFDDKKSDSGGSTPMSLSPSSNPSTPKSDQLVPPTSVSMSSDSEPFQKSSTSPPLPPPQVRRKASLHNGESVIISKTKKRQEKNREAAQLFRQRQKAKVAELEKKMQTLIEISNDYRLSIDALFSENKLLTDQLVYWKTIVASGILISQAPSTSPVGYGLSGDIPRQQIFEELKRVTENLQMQQGLK